MPDSCLSSKSIRCITCRFNYSSVVTEHPQNMNWQGTNACSWCILRGPYIVLQLRRSPARYLRMSCTEGSLGRQQKGTRKGPRMQQTAGEKYSLCHLFRTSLPQCIGQVTPSRIEPKEETPLLPRCTRSFLFVPFFLVFESYPTPREEFPSSGSFPEDDRSRRAARPISDADNDAGRRRAVRRRSPLDDEGGESHQTQGHADYTLLRAKHPSRAAAGSTCAASYPFSALQGN